VSRVGEDKGTDLLVAAVERLARRRPQRVVLELAGQVGPGERRWWGQLRRRAAALERDGRLVWHGPLPLAGKLALLRRLDVFVAGSRIAERRGMAALEAMAAGVPVAAPARGIFPELIDRTGGGVTFEPESAASLADAVARLMDDAAARRRMGAAAREGMVAHYSGACAALKMDAVLAAAGG
jgi:glycosyltransferase involved in cell wall biosynthesis